MPMAAKGWSASELWLQDGQEGVVSSRGGLWDTDPGELPACWSRASLFKAPACVQTRFPRWRDAPACETGLLAGGVRPWPSLGTGISVNVYSLP